jgi:hypothetical protein
VILDTYVTHYLVHVRLVHTNDSLPARSHQEAASTNLSISCGLHVGSAVTCLHVGTSKACIMNVLIVHPTFIDLVNLKVAPKILKLMSLALLL